jgi:quercetin dioxygenase-like cupin family protein
MADPLMKKCGGFGRCTVFGAHDPDGYRKVLPGIHMKTLCYGERTLMTEYLLEPGSTLPMHAHPHEQTGYLVRGHIRLTIGGREHDTRPGDCWCIPSGVEHGAQIVEDSVAVEVFSPVREDYLPPDAPGKSRTAP